MTILRNIFVVVFIIIGVSLSRDVKLLNDSLNHKDGEGVGVYILGSVEIEEHVTYEQLPTYIQKINIASITTIVLGLYLFSRNFHPVRKTKNT